MLASADIILHARLQGESFGMVILEAMQAGKDILAWSGGWDRNHTKLLASSCLYKNRKDLRAKLRENQSKETILLNEETANNFRIKRVMPKFKEVFGHGIL
jgi:glycosyltransferase involved in cell wall biosynthesis